MTILSKIEKVAFLATEADVEALARDHLTATEHGQQLTGTYLRVLVAQTTADIHQLSHTTTLAKRLGARRKRLPASETAEHLAVFDAVNTRYYAAVVRAVVGPDLAPSDSISVDEQQRRSRERGRRTNYARSAASTLRSFIRSGADIRDLVLAEVSKGQLRALTARPRRQSIVSVARLLKTATREVEAAVKDVERLAKLDPGEAATLLGVLSSKLAELRERMKPAMRRAA